MFDFILDLNIGYRNKCFSIDYDLKNIQTIKLSFHYGITWYNVV